MANGMSRGLLDRARSVFEQKSVGKNVSDKGAFVRKQAHAYLSMYAKAASAARARGAFPVGARR